jgi:hypothetical protein
MFHVDIPTPDCLHNPDGAWQNVATCASKPAAVAFIREHFGPCDDDGNIGLLTECPDDNTPPQIPPPFAPAKCIDGHGPTNGDRADRAEAALAAYRGDDQPDESHLADLLCDLMHLAHREGRDFDAELARGRSCFTEER